MMAGRTLLLAGCLLVATSALGQPRSWQDLSPDERARAWRNYQRFEALPPQRRQYLEDRYQRFRAMPPNEQERLRRNYNAYRGFPPDKQRQFQQNYRRWKQGKRCQPSWWRGGASVRAADRSTDPSHRARPACSTRAAGASARVASRPRRAEHCDLHTCLFRERSIP
jgi:hypothetical protein